MVPRGGVAERGGVDVKTAYAVLVTTWYVAWTLVGGVIVLYVLGRFAEFLVVLVAA